jgi:hypothetical protein
MNSSLGARVTSKRGARSVSEKRCWGAEKGPDARRRPKLAREAYSLYVERASEGANEAGGPFSAP